MKKTNAGNVGNGLKKQDVKIVYPVASVKINLTQTIQRQSITNLTVYRSGSSGRVLFAESERAQ